MRPAALAVLLTLCVPVQLLGQRSTGNPPPSSSPPSSSPSSGSSSNSGGGSSGGYSGGGGPHSSAPSSSGGSGGYSGGSAHSSGTSSSGGSSGGSTGGAHSGGYSGGTSNNGGSRSTGSAGTGNSGAHSGSAPRQNSETGFSPAQAGRVSSQPASTQGAPQSNVRTGNSNSEQWRSSGADLRSSAANSSRPTSQVVSIQQQAWILEALRFNTDTNVKSALRQGKSDAELKGLGLAPNKSVYREQVSKFGGDDISRKQPGWFAKHILGRQEKQQTASSPMLRPCPGEECKPIVPPPKPCVGKKCRPAPPPPPPGQPPTTPVSGVCMSGIPNRVGECEPWGYFDHCGRRGDCYLQLSAVDSSYCEDIRNRIRLEEQSAVALENQRLALCSPDSQGASCASVTQDLQLTRSRIEQLRRQYQMCRMASGWQSVRYP